MTLTRPDVDADAVLDVTQPEVLGTGNGSLQKTSVKPDPYWMAVTPTIRAQSWQ